MTNILTVDLSEDAWNGDAQATLTVNGIPVGGTLVVTATNAADNVQAFTFTGNFGTNPTVALSFINDASSGVAGQDRNLYLDGFTYDGVAQLNFKQALAYDQTDTYSLSSAQPQGVRAADFTNSIGTIAHYDYLNTSYGLPNGQSPNLPLIISSLAYLGVTHLRIGIPTAQTLPWLQTLAAAGIKFDVLMPSASSTSLLPGQIAAINAIAGSVVAVEGPNEINTTSGFSWNGQFGSAGAVAYQQALWFAVQADPKLSNAAVYNFTLGSSSAGDYTALGNVAPYVTDGNVHVYYSNSTPPASTLQWVLGIEAPATSRRPTVITETNYSTAPTIEGSVNDAVQASYDLNLLMDATKDGVASTYFYELLDEASDPSDTNNEDHFGLFNADGSPKLAATGLHNLSTVLADSGVTASTFTPGTLNYVVSGLPASGNSLVLEKSNGTYDIVVWAEPEIWNATTITQVVATPRQVEVTLPGVATVNVYDPLSGAAAIAHYTSTATVGVTVTDHPIIIEVTGSGSSAPVPPVVTMGSGSDKLALTVSEDAFQGDAQFTISVDGQQIGGTQTAQASHAAGASQEYDVLGTFGSGTHTASVNFLNDLYTPGVGDRNLYTEGASFDGTQVSGAALSLMSAGIQHFNFVVPPAVPPVVTMGSGSDKLALTVSEDAFQGDAQFTISVDGQQIGGTQTAQASHAAGASQEYDVLGTFGSGTHTASVNFLNDLYTPGVGDRNLYTEGASFDGTQVSGAALSLMSAGIQHFNFVVPPAVPPVVTMGSGSDKLALTVSEDAFQGDAQFTISVDGQQIGGTQTAQASHAAGASQEYDVLGTFGSGTHTASVNFLNDLYTPGVGDRNLYTEGASFDGTQVSGAALSLMSAGIQHFNFVK